MIHFKSKTFLEDKKKDEMLGNAKGSAKAFRAKAKGIILCKFKKKSWICFPIKM